VKQQDSPFSAALQVATADFPNADPAEGVHRTRWRARLEWLRRLHLQLVRSAWCFWGEKTVRGYEFTDAGEIQTIAGSQTFAK